MESRQISKHMKKLFLSLMLLLPVMVMAQDAAYDEMVARKDSVFVKVERMPEFPGGQQAMFEFLSKNVHYPKVAEKARAQGRVICQFVVNQDGTIEDVHVVRSGGHVALDKEAVRVIKLMPKWKPGKMGGEPVRVKYTVPVNFRL